MDRFVHALVPEVRLQVELRGPLDFHEAMMYAEHGDAVIVHASSQDTGKPWQKSSKGGLQQCPPMQLQQRAETCAQCTSGLELMELGMAR